MAIATGHSRASFILACKKDFSAVTPVVVFSYEPIYLIEFIIC